MNHSQNAPVPVYVNANSEIIVCGFTSSSTGFHPSLNDTARYVQRIYIPTEYSYDVPTGGAQATTTNIVERVTRGRRSTGSGIISARRMPPRVPNRSEYRGTARPAGTTAQASGVARGAATSTRYTGTARPAGTTTQASGVARAPGNQANNPRIRTKVVRVRPETSADNPLRAPARPSSTITPRRAPAASASASASSNLPRAPSTQTSSERTSGSPLRASARPSSTITPRRAPAASASASSNLRSASGTQTSSERTSGSPLRAPSRPSNTINARSAPAPSPASNLPQAGTGRIKTRVVKEAKATPTATPSTKPKERRVVGSKVVKASVVEESKKVVKKAVGSKKLQSILLGKKGGK